eukprot:superscaffoldBa00001816_g12137
MFFNLTSHNDSQLQCEVNVTRDPRIVLSIVHDGCKFPAKSNDVTALPYDTLSETISLKGRGKYECQLHLNEDLIMQSSYWHPPDTMFFNLTSHNDSQLQCEVNVTRDPRIVLSIVHDGWKFQTVNNAVTALPYNTLSETISLKGRGKYECQLHLNEDLIMKSIFHWHSPEPDVVFPEPWFLYMAILLVPIIILLCLVIAMLKDRCCVVQHLAGTERRSKGESASLCHGACVEVDSDTEAVANKGFKLGCISCKMRGEVPAIATVSWYFRASDETEFSHCIFNRVLRYTNYEFETNTSKTIVINVVPRLTRGMASILSEVMMYVSIIGLQLWLVVEMIYCYRKIAAAGEEALRESAAEYLAIASESKDNCAGEQVAE